MKKSLVLALFILVCVQVSSQEWITPVIPGYGQIKNFEDVAIRPDAAIDYKLVFDVKSGDKKDGVNVGLWKIARTLNMLGAANIPSEKIKIVAAIHGEATFASLNNERHEMDFNAPNPNLDLLRLLRDNGVELYVCAQATAARNIEQKDLDPNVTLALSALSVLANYQLMGYAFMP
jgi:intracellular sulfur oxidation DsrE/DsrF family protein